MLSAEAYSFTQKSRLAISLSWIAGYTNVVTLMTTGHVVSHVTGNTTYFGNAFAAANRPWAAYYAFLLASFFLGAVLSAFMTEGARRRGRPSKYVLPMAVEAVLLVVFAIGVELHARVTPDEIRTLYWITGVAALAMGLQNATITRISGAVVRTTHLTGVVTDLGLEGVQFLLWYRDRLKGMKPDRLGRVLRITQRHPTFQRLALLASIFGSFIFGVCAATVVFSRFPAQAMGAPVAFLLWIIYTDWRHPIADVRELDLLSDPELQMHGLVKSLLPPELGIYRVAHHRAERRAPNFQAWADRVPRRWRVIVLALSPVTHLDANAVMNLSTAVSKLRDHGRTLIVAGLTPTQFKALDQHGAVELLSLDNVAPDLEFGIARALAIIHHGANPDDVPRTA
jgi:uncharacterized membrane protein YoaK (UPF0700 family)/anti-anti-sigma regulatory factor